MLARRPARTAAACAAVLPALLLAFLHAPRAEGIAPDPLRSGFDDMSRENQALQRDDTANPGLLWVQDGEDLWTRKPTPGGRACADCHGGAASLRGVAARYPAFDAQTAQTVDLQGRVNLCRSRHQGHRLSRTRAPISWR